MVNPAIVKEHRLTMLIVPVQCKGTSLEWMAPSALICRVVTPYRSLARRCANPDDDFLNSTCVAPEFAYNARACQS